MIRERLRIIIKKSQKLSRFLVSIFIRLHNYSYHKISEYAGYLNNDIHPKHTITNYHKFFLENINKEDRILDIGCGNGFLSYDLALKAKLVVGIDIKNYNIDDANKRYKRNNLKFIVGDATIYDFKERFDKIVLSNVLEHIENRISFLEKIRKIANIVILRVPMENRDWLTIYKKQNGYEYMLDKTHFIEYTVDTLNNELKKGRWQLERYQINWGELWGIIKQKN